MKTGTVPEGNQWGAPDLGKHFWKVFCCTVAAGLMPLAASFLLPATSMAEEVPQDFGRQPIFADEFDGTSLNRSQWDHRGVGQRNHCINTPDAVRVKDGFLRITTYTEKGSKPGESANYCGMVSTASGFHGRYGYWVANVRFNRVPGMQCAFWIQSSSIGKRIGDAADSGVEMDVFEHLAEASAQEYDHALHWDGYGDMHKQVATVRKLPALQDGKFHRFAISWKPSGYTFSVDGKVTYEVPASRVPVSTIPEYVILSSEVPRGFPVAGFGDKKHSKATFDVDYVRVYPYSPNEKSSALHAVQREHE